MKVVKPAALKKGDTIGVIALSDYVSGTDLIKSTKVVESWGLKVKFGKNLFNRTFDFSSGTPEQRKEDLWDMLRDDEVKVIWFAAGGYSMLQIMNIINERLKDRLREEKKWFIGYSDNSIFCHYLSTIDHVSIHGPNFSGLYSWDKKSIDWIKDILFGKTPKSIPTDEKWKRINSGEAKGKLIVSNLTCLVNTFGTKFDPLEDGSDDIILAVEEFDTFKSEIKRLFEVIMLHKKSNRIKGIVLGRFTNLMKHDYPNWAKANDAYTIITDAVLAHRNIPIAQTTCFGHPTSFFRRPERGLFSIKEKFLAMPNSIETEFIVDEDYCTLKFEDKIS